MAIIISSITPIRAISLKENFTPSVPATSIFSLAFSTTQWSISTDKPVTADYDCGSRTDIAVYRSGTRSIVQSLNGRSGFHQFGLSDDIPIAGIQSLSGGCRLSRIRRQTHCQIKVSTET
jgi:hypothetical protein